MSKKLILAGAACTFLAVATAASAVTFDLSSPQEGTVVAPGDTLSLTLTLGNDTADKDVVVLKFKTTIAINGQAFTLGASKGLRLRLEPGQTVTRTVEVTLPSTLPSQIPQGSLDLTVEGTATGLRSQTTATDTLSLTFQN